jgi:hypothetical protein
MANMEIQHVLIALKPQHQGRPRGNRRCVSYRSLLGASPVRDAEFTVAGLPNATDGEEVASPVRRGRVERSPVWNSRDMHSLRGSAGLP